MRGVGYVVGNSLEDIQNQWALFIDAEVDVILFDRHILSEGFDYTNSENSDPEKESIWKYMETMSTSQDMMGNHDNYQKLEDLQPGDTLVLTKLSKLRNSKYGIWEDMYRMLKKGVHLAILSDGFKSAGSYGDHVLSMINEAYQLGAGSLKK